MDVRHLVWSPTPASGTPDDEIVDQYNWINQDTGGRLGFGSTPIGSTVSGTDTDQLLFDGSVSLEPALMRRPIGYNITVQSITMLSNYDGPNSVINIGGNNTLKLEASGSPSFFNGGQIVLGENYYHTPGMLVIAGNTEVSWNGTLLTNGDAQSRPNDLFLIQSGAGVTLGTNGSSVFWNDVPIEVSASTVQVRAPFWDLSGANLLIVSQATIIIGGTGCLVRQDSGNGEIDIYSGNITVSTSQFMALVRFDVVVTLTPQAPSTFVSQSGFTEFTQGFEVDQGGDFFLYGGSTVQCDQGFYLSGGNLRVTGNGVGTIVLGGQGFLASQGTVFIGASQGYQGQDSPTLSVQPADGANPTFSILGSANLQIGVYYSINGPHFSVLQCLIPIILSAPQGTFGITSVFDAGVNPVAGQEFMMIQDPNYQMFFSFGTYALNWSTATMSGIYGYNVEDNDVVFFPVAF